MFQRKVKQVKGNKEGWEYRKEQGYDFRSCAQRRPDKVIFKKRSEESEEISPMDT